MTQYSWPWSTVTAHGDGATTLSETNARLFLAAYFGVQNLAVEGVSKGVLNELACTGVASPIAVASGSGICYGLYYNDASVNLAVTSPVVGTTGGCVVLQTNWDGVGGGAQASTRLVARKNTDGVASIPALTQVVGTTWEIPLATFTITTGGVITLTDARTYRKSTMVVAAGGIDPAAVTSANLRNSAAVSVIGRSANSIGAPADIAAGADDRILARVAAALSWVQLTLGMIPDALITGAKMVANTINTAQLALNSVDDTIAGNRVPQFYRRQGGDAADWSISGASSYTPTAVRQQAGSKATSAAGDVTVIFPVAFSAPPIVVLSATLGAVGSGVVTTVTATQFTCGLWDNTHARIVGTVDWFAVGPE